MKLESPRPWKHWSPSQVKTFRRCASKWWLQKIAGREEPQGAGAALGDWLHAFAEEYLLNGTAPLAVAEDVISALQDEEGDFEFFLLCFGFEKGEDLAAQVEQWGADEVETRIRRAAAALTAGIHYLPDPPVTHRHVEAEVDLQFPSAAVSVKGYVDLLEPPTINREGKVELLVTDHKSTSNISRYALTEEELKRDPQAIVYGSEALSQLEVGCFDEVLKELGWWRNPWTRKLHPLVDGDAATVADEDAVRIRVRFVYYQTRAHRAAEVSTTFTPQELHEGVRRLIDEVVQPMASLATETDLSKVPHNLDACSDYGGCPHRATCARIGRRTLPMAGLFGSATNTGDHKPMSDGIQALLAARRAQNNNKTEPPPPPPEAAPPPPEPPQINPPDGTPPEKDVSKDPPKPKPSGTGWVLPGEVFFGVLVEYAGADPNRLKKLPLRDEVIPALRNAIVACGGELGQPDGFTYEDDQIPKSVKADDVKAEVCRLLAIWESLVDAGKTQDFVVEEPPAKEPPTEPPSTETPAEKPTEEVVEHTQEFAPSPDGTELFVGCVPQGEAVVYLDELLLPLQKRACEAKKALHFELIPYAEGPKLVAAALDVELAEKKMDLPSRIVSRFPRREEAAIAVLARYVARVVSPSVLVG